MIFLILALLQTKHLIVDFILQSAWIVEGKGTYGHPGGLVHAGEHALFTAAILLLAPISFATVLIIAVSEFVIHYHIDWFKDWSVKRLDADPRQWKFWVLTGVDQYAHQVTYLGILVGALLLA
ncbi:DUF3307 domain-containing protein [Marivita geojedonensis]|nr:DUF3307 domain-containing protein [Marivita geojedonensis]